MTSAAPRQRIKPAIRERIKRRVRQTIEVYEHMPAPCDSHVMHARQVERVDRARLNALYLPRYLYRSQNDHLHEVTWELKDDGVWWATCLECGYLTAGELTEEVLARTRYIVWYTCEKCYGASEEQLEAWASAQGFTRRDFLDMAARGVIGAGMGYGAFINGFERPWGLKPMPAEAVGLTRYVSNVAANGFSLGNNSWDGTSPTFVSGTTGPKLTITGASGGLSVIGSRDTLVINSTINNPFNEHILASALTGKNGTAINAMTIIKAAPGGRVLLMPTAVQVHVVNTGSGSQYIQFEDIETNGINVTGDGLDCFKIDGTTAPISIRLVRCKATQAQQNGFFATAYCVRCEIIDCESWESGFNPGQDHNIYINRSDSFLVQGCFSHTCREGNGIQLNNTCTTNCPPSPTDRVTNPVVRRTRFFDIDRHGVVVADRCHSAAVYENQVWRAGVAATGAAGLSHQSGGATGLYMNNSVHQTVGPGMRATAGTSEWRNNIILECNPNVQANPVGATFGTNILTGVAANYWEDPGTRDYRTKATAPAPAIDGGENLLSRRNSGPWPEPTPTSFYGTTRGFGAGWDLGSDERTGASTPPLSAQITAPPNNAEVTGTFSVNLQAQGAQGASHRFVVVRDGTTTLYDVTASTTTRSFSWDSASVSDGSHTLALTVTDGLGRTATHTITVIVDNAPPTPTPPPDTFRTPVVDRPAVTDRPQPPSVPFP